MLHCRPRIALFALLSTLALPSLGLAQQPPRPEAGKPALAVNAPPQAGPLSQPVPALRPEDMPAQPPQVTYQNGQLTIVAQNSRLSDILTAVRARTGASLDMPPQTANERVATQLGPGPAPQVIADLLAGSHFDYIILGTTQDPTGVVTLILTWRNGSDSVAPQASRAASSQPEEEPEVLPEEPPAPMPPQPPAAQNPQLTQPPQVFPLPQSQPPQTLQQQMPPDQQQPAEQQDQQNPGQPGQQPGGQQQIRTPEQLLQQLRQMQQRQQQQQNQNTPPQQ